MSASRRLVAFGLLALLCCSSSVWCQGDGDGDAAPAPEGDGDGNMDGVENDGGRGSESDGNDGDDTSLGTAPPGALIGCTSPYSYTVSEDGLSIFQTLLDVSGLQEGIKYRNFSGTLLAPTNNALRNLGAQLNIDVDRPTELPRPLLRSIIQYHVLFDPIDPTTLAAIAQPTPYDTSLSLTPQGANAGLQTPIYQLLVKNDQLDYQNVTLVVTPLSPGVSAEAAPNGTYRVEAGASAGNLIWDATNEPYRTCSGFIYKIDGALLPPGTLDQLSAGAAAPTGAETGDGNDENAPPGEGDGADTEAEGDGDASPAPPASGDGND